MEFAPAGFSAPVGGKSGNRLPILRGEIPPQKGDDLVTEILSVHPQNPQPRLIRRAAELLKGGVCVYPTDSHYALGCSPDNADAVRKIRRLRGVEASHPFTLCCADLRQIGEYGEMDNSHFRLAKRHIPGPYTFILQASGRVRRGLLENTRRRTVGFRVNAHPVAAALLHELGEPILTTTLRLAGQEKPADQLDDIIPELRGQVDLILDAGMCESVPTTVLDFTESPPRLIRPGGGEVEEIEE